MARPPRGAGSPATRRATLRWVDGDRAEPRRRTVLRSLRDHRGGPALHVRVLAALLVLGLVALSAPVVGSLLRWLWAFALGR